VISNTATLKVSPVAGVPDHIELKTIPNEFELFGNEYGYLVVELEDGLGRPAMADHDIEVEITVEPEIVSVPKRLVIRKGESYSFAKFEIGGIEGTAKLTALADEYGEASTTLTVAAREASKLSVYVLPSEVTSGSTVYVFAQLLDEDGNPVRAIGPTDVYLSSTGGRLQSDRLEFKRGDYVAFTRLTVSSPGSFEVRAMAEGLGNATAELEVYPPFYTSKGELRIQTLPSMLADGCKHDIVFVQLLDEQGLPAVPMKDVEVRLFSSSPEMANLSTVVLEGGSPYVIGRITLGSKGGEVWIDGHSEIPVEGAKLELYAEEPTSLEIAPFVDPLLSGSEGHALVYLSAEGRPVKPWGSFELNSSDPSLSIEVEEVTDYFTLLGLKSESPKNYTLSAECEGFSGSALLSVVPSTPRGISLLIEPDLILADGKWHDIGVIELTDGEGNLMAPYRGIEVRLYSTPQVSVPSRVEVPKWSPIERFKVRAMEEGVANLTAVSEGIGVAGASLNLTLLELKLSAELKGVTALEPAILKVSATRDGVGVEGVRVKWGLPEGVEVSGENETGPGGLLNATLIFHRSGKIGLWIEAEKEGYRSVNSSLVVEVEPKRMDVLLTSDKIRLGPGEVAHLTVMVVSGNKVVKGAVLEWSSSSGTITGESLVTDDRGMGEAFLHPKGSGTISVKVLAYKEGYEKKAGVLNIYVSSGLPFGLSGLQLILYILVPAGAVVVALLYVKRRRRKKTPEEVGEYV
ncbi:MAG: hypothetical protein J7K45_03030, partial [Thaumarchaeota archaeon]|nr:hypothetical protein [Nitrososphaerota archaeon]